MNDNYKEITYLPGVGFDLYFL